MKLTYLFGTELDKDILKQQQEYLKYFINKADDIIIQNSQLTKYAIDSERMIEINKVIDQMENIIKEIDEYLERY